jgi:argininosuccinate lyase
MAKKLWGGRFKKKTDSQFEVFSESFKWDARLLPYDLAIDAAQARALRRCGVLTAGEEKKLLSAISTLQKQAANGALKLDPEAEDVHSAVQAKLSQLAGEVADKIHTGRSRNDLVAQSSRLYVKAHAQKIAATLTALQKSIVAKADRYQKTLVPGMTHLQNAQVVSQAHIFLAYAEMLERSKARLALVIELADVCVLGSGALAGTTFKLDQAKMARELGLSRVVSNSYDVSGDRDFVLNFLSSLSFLGTHLSRIAEDLMIGQLKGVALIDVDQAFCTGSSMMPQKKNADFLELSRGMAGVLTGNLAGFLTTLKGLPTSYNRDLQWDKKFLFDSVETVTDALEIFTRLFATLKINEARAQELVQDETLYATDFADYLVRKGMPFKKAHEAVGEVVSFAEENGVALSKIGLDIVRRFAPLADGGYYDLFNAEHSVRLKATAGSTHPAQVARQIQIWKKRTR